MSAALFAFAASLPHEMTSRQLAILAYLAGHPRTTVRDMAIALRVGKPIVTRAADRLAHLIRREGSPDDKRMVLMSLTPGGRLFVEETAVRMHGRTIAYLRG